MQNKDEAKFMRFDLIARFNGLNRKVLVLV